jgi:hypothetical protein
MAVLGEAPSNCPGPEPRTQKVADFVGPVAGGSPLWAGFYATYDPATNAYSAPDAPRTEQGWRIKNHFPVEHAHRAPVELTGTSVDEPAATVTFDIEDAEPGATAIFDRPSVPVTHAGWREFPTYAYFPVAGCYGFRATWTDGSWELGFGFGR